MFELRRPIDGTGHRLPAVAGALAAALAGAVYWIGPPGVDEPAHVFQTWIFAHHGFVWWSNDWYSGRYEFVSYSVLYYPLASLVGIGLTAVAAAATFAAAAAAAMRNRFGTTAATGPAVLLALLATFNMMVGGTYPFQCGAAAAALALLAAQRGRRFGFLAAGLVTLGFSPLALALLAVILAGAAAADPGMLLRNRLLAGGTLAILVLGALLQRLFDTGATYPYQITDAIVIGVFCAAGAALAGVRPAARVLRMTFVVYLVVNAGALAVSAPIGSNAGRLFVEAGTPLLWLTANVARRRSRTVAMVLAAACVLQAAPFARDFAWSWTDPATTAGFWSPAIGFLRAHPDPQQRVEVVASWGHWESDYLPRAGFPIARGWFRQDDFPQNAVLYDTDLSASEYLRWLRSVGVHYVVLPDGPLDYSSGAEARLLRSGRSGLPLIGRYGQTQVYALPRPTPIVTGPGGPTLTSLTGGQVEFGARQSGWFLVRVRYSPYWSGAQTRRGPGGMTLVRATGAGIVRLTLQPW